MAILTDGKKESIYIFGHQNPDSDSVCSSIAYAHLKNALGFENAKAFRLGKLNKETSFILDYFSLPEPELLNDIRIRLSDLNLYTPRCLKKHEPMRRAWDALSGSTESGARMLPVTSERGNLEGIVSIGNITSVFLNRLDEDITANNEILFKNLLDIIDGNLVSGEYRYDQVCGSFFIGADVPKDVNVSDKDIIVTGTLENAMRFAYALKVGCVILTNGVRAEGLEHSKSAVVTVRHNMFKTVSMIKEAISVKSIMEADNLVTFLEDSDIDDVSEIMKTSAHRNFPVIRKDGTFRGIVSRRHLIGTKQKNVILIDHNEKSQSVEGIENADILEIIDHHRVADIQTNSPLFIRSEPVGSTATIISKMYYESRIDIPERIAGILLSAILSDTLMFSSPTCTDDDKDAANKLADAAGVSIEEYGRKMFAVSTSLDNMTVAEILSSDRKKFNFGKYTAYISQVNTLDFSSVSARTDSLLEKMEQFCRDTGCDIAMLMVTNIVEHGTEILVTGKGKELVCATFGMNRGESSIFLPGVISRKKQIVPRLFQNNH